MNAIINSVYSFLSVFVQKQLLRAKNSKKPE